MRVFTCNDHAGLLVGTASVVVAPSEMEARLMLAAELLRRHLDPSVFTLRELDATQPSVRVLQDGDY